MRRETEFTLEQLLDKESDWLEREDETNNQWINEGGSLLLTNEVFTRES